MPKDRKPSPLRRLSSKIKSTFDADGDGKLGFSDLGAGAKKVKEAMAGLLDPLMKDGVTGQAEVRKIFELSKGGNVAGCAVTSGKLLRGKMRVVRKGDLVYEGISHTLKRFKDEVNEVRSGMESGIRLDGFDDFQEGDIIECYTQEKVAQSL